MPCPTCRSGCACPMDGPGCGHYGCLARGPVDCPGAEAEERRYHAILAQRRRDYRRQRIMRNRLSASFRAVAATTALGLPRVR